MIEATAIGLFEYATGALFSGVIGNKAYREFNKRVKALRQEQSHTEEYLKRCTYRSVLLATNLSIQNVLDSNDAQKLADNFIVNNEQNYNVVNSLTCRIHKLAHELRPKGILETTGQLNDRLNVAMETCEKLMPDISVKWFKHIGSLLDDDCPLDILKEKLYMREAVEFLICNIVLKMGYWGSGARTHIEGNVKSLFFGTNKLWVSYFVRFYLDELEADSNLVELMELLRNDSVEHSLMQLKNSSKEFCNKLDITIDSTDSLILSNQKIIEYCQELDKKVKLLIDKHNSQFHINGNNVFYQPQTAKSGGSFPMLRSFYFAEEQDKFIGREKELALLDERLLGQQSMEKDKFKWGVIRGNAGTGKSRLALEVLSKYKEIWRLNGFVSKNFINRFDHHLISLEGLTGPTLFIIDYAANSPEQCSFFIERCASLHETSEFPIRIIVLVRTESDSVFQSTEKQHESASVHNAQVSFGEGNLEEKQALHLEALADGRTVELMRSRIEQTLANAEKNESKEDFSDKDDDELLEALRFFDEQMRPLFAAIVANSIANNTLDKDFNEQNKEKARLNLFWDYIEHEFTKRWIKVLGEKTLSETEKVKIDKHITFIILSTMSRGLEDNLWQAVIEEQSSHQIAKMLLPHNPIVTMDNYGEDKYLLDEKMIKDLLGVNGNLLVGGLYPALEPDLIGEALVIKVLSSDQQEYSLLSATARRRQEYLSNLAWATDPNGMAFFTVLVAQDYPEAAANLNWLLPNDLELIPTNIAAELFASLALVQIQFLSEREPRFGDIEQISNLIKVFNPILFSEKSLYLIALKRLLDLVEHLSFVINKNVTPTSFVAVTQLNQHIRRTSIDFLNASKIMNESLQTDGLEVKEYKQSSEEVVESVIALLHELYSKSLPFVFNNNNIEATSQLFKIVRSIVVSVFWNERANIDRHGFAYKAPTSEEIQLRNDLVDQCITIIKSQEFSESNFATACGLISSVIYAEYMGVAQDKERARDIDILQRLLKVAERHEFKNESFIASLFNFVFNCSVSIFIYRESIKSELTQAELQIPLKIVRMLVNNVLDLAELSCLSGSKIVDNFAMLVDSYALYFKKIDQHEVSISILHEYYPLLLQMIDKVQDYKIQNGVFKYICQYIYMNRMMNASNSELIADFSRLLNVKNCDRKNFNDKLNSNMGFYLFELLEISADYVEKIEFIVHRMLDDVGIRAKETFVSIIINYYPKLNTHVDTLKHLSKRAFEDEKLQLKIEDKVKVELVLLSQSLLDGRVENIFDELMTIWTIDLDEFGFKTRTIVFYKLHLLVLWLGIENDDIMIWRKRVFSFLGLSFNNSNRIDNDIIRTHNQAAYEVVASMMCVEVAAGYELDDYMALL